jgi:predicted amidohydrolase YtcJ
VFVIAPGVSCGADTEGPSQPPADTEFSDMLLYGGKILTIATGKVADFVIVDRHPLEIATEELVDLKVIKTVSGGRTVFEAT